MAKNPSTRFYFNDWMNEPGLRLCSVGARGLWMDMLCLCAAADRPGYLEIDGKPCGPCELARRVNAPKASVRRWLGELERYAVFSRDENGTIFNRRLVRELGHKTRRTTPKRPDRERNSKQPELFDNPEKLRTRACDSGTFGASQNPKSESLPDSESPAASADEKMDMGESSERPAGALGEIGEVVKTRMPARLADRHRDGVNDAQPSQAPAADYKPSPGEAATLWKGAAPILPANQRDLDLDGQDNDNPRQEPAMCTHGFSPGSAPSRRTLGGAPVLGRQQLDCRPAPRADRPRPRTKTPALRGKIRDQLQAKHGRFLVACRPQREVEAYWAAMLGDDPTEAQRVFDATDRRMRAARWDDTREVAA